MVLSGKGVDFFGCGCTMLVWDMYGPGVWSGHGGVSPEGRLWCALSPLVVARALQRAVEEVLAARQLPSRLKEKPAGIF